MTRMLNPITLRIDNMDMDKNQTDTTDTAAIRTIDIFI